jgi:hypothetical protein
MRDGKPQIRGNLSLKSRTSSSRSNESIDNELSTQQLKDIKTAMSKMMKQQHMCEINHTIPLIDESLVIPWRPTWISAKLHEQWTKKKATYLASGHWRVSAARNAVPVLCIPKPNMHKNKPELKTVVDLQEIKIL